MATATKSRADTKSNNASAASDANKNSGKPKSASSPNLDPVRAADPGRDAARAKRMQMIDATIGKLETAFGKGSIMRLGQHSLPKIDTIPTGSRALDKAIGAGGVPRGRITEVFGPESSGKTTLALHVIANAQRAGGIAALIDAEHAFDPSWAKKIGLDLDGLLVSQPDSGEQALSIVEELVQTGALDVIVVDSVAALVPRAELEGEMGDTHVGLQARLMSQALRKLTGIVNRSKTALVFINQIREKIGVMFGNPETTPGGRALKFYSSLRLDIRKIGQVKDGDVSIGTRAKVTVAKNKTAPPFGKCEFDIVYERGIDAVGELLELGAQFGVVEKTGSWFSYQGTRLGQGRARSTEFLLDTANREVRHQIEAALQERLFPAPAPEPQAKETATCAAS